MAVVSIKNKLRRGNLLVGNDTFIPSSFESIATVAVGSGGASSVEFTSIGTDWTHLQVRFIGKSTRASGFNDFLVTLNGDTSASYALHLLYGNGSTVTATGVANQSTYVRILANAIPSADTTNMFAAGIVDILDYANTNKAKTLRALGGNDLNGSGYLTLGSVLWTNTNAITSLKFTPETFNWGQYTHFALYGIKGA